MRSLCLPVLAAVLSLAPAALLGEEPEVIPLWPATAPGETGDIGEEHEQPNKPGDNIIRIANVSRPTLTVFRAPADRANGTSVVICPGGGYHILAWNLEGTEIAEWLNSLGVTAAVLKYRVPGRKGQERYAASLQDAQRALGLLRQRADSLALDPARMGVLGFSAGGHLAAALSTNYETRSYAKVDEADDINCRPDFVVLIYPAYLTQKDNSISPELKLTPQTPPTFLVHTQDDGVPVEGSVHYYLALKGQKVPSELHVYPTGGHGYGLRPSAHAVSLWPQRTADWMKSRQLLPARAP